MERKKEKVTVEMYKLTIDDLNFLKNYADLSSGADALKVSVDIAVEVANIIKNGGRIIVEDKDKNKTRLLIDGFRSAV